MLKTITLAIVLAASALTVASVPVSASTGWTKSELQQLSRSDSRDDQYYSKQLNSLGSN